MRIASVQEIKVELENLPLKELKLLCLRLARFKKENKELLTYILFESHDPASYISLIKTEIDEGFSELPKSNVYLTKKSLRKLLRNINKYLRLMGSAEAEIEILLYFALSLKDSGIVTRKSTALVNILESQVKKIRKGISTLHEDLQYDYLKQLEVIE